MTLSSFADRKDQQLVSYLIWPWIVRGIIRGIIGRKEEKIEVRGNI